jgi:hypothetical protein
MKGLSPTNSIRIYRKEQHERPQFQDSASFKPLSPQPHHVKRNKRSTKRKE